MSVLRTVGGTYAAWHQSLKQKLAEELETQRIQQQMGLQKDALKLQQDEFAFDKTYKADALFANNTLEYAKMQETANAKKEALIDARRKSLIGSRDDAHNNLRSITTNVAGMAGVRGKPLQEMMAPEIKRLRELNAQLPPEDRLSEETLASYEKVGSQDFTTDSYAGKRILIGQQTADASSESAAARTTDAQTNRMRAEETATQNDANNARFASEWAFKKDYYGQRARYMEARIKEIGQYSPMRFQLQVYNTKLRELALRLADARYRSDNQFRQATLTLQGELAQQENVLKNDALYQELFDEFDADSSAAMQGYDADVNPLMQDLNNISTDYPVVEPSNGTLPSGAGRNTAPGNLDKQSNLWNTTGNNGKKGSKGTLKKSTPVPKAKSINVPNNKARGKF